MNTPNYTPETPLETPALPTCRTCPYWDTSDFDIDSSFDWPEGESQEQFLARAMAAGVVVVGECRRFPRPWQGKRSNKEKWTDLWPRTANDDWCGEHPRFPAYVAAWLTIQNTVGHDAD